MGESVRTTVAAHRGFAALDLCLRYLPSLRDGPDSSAPAISIPSYAAHAVGSLGQSSAVLRSHVPLSTLLALQRMLSGSWLQCKASAAYALQNLLQDYPQRPPAVGSAWEGGEEGEEQEAAASSSAAVDGGQGAGAALAAGAGAAVGQPAAAARRRPGTPVHVALGREEQNGDAGGNDGEDEDAEDGGSSMAPGDSPPPMAVSAAPRMVARAWTADAGVGPGPGWGPGRCGMSSGLYRLSAF